MKKIVLKRDEYLNMVCELKEFHTFQLKNAHNFLQEESPSVQVLEDCLYKLHNLSQAMGSDYWVIIADNEVNKLLNYLDLVLKFKTKNAVNLGIDPMGNQKIKELKDIVNVVKFKTQFLTTYSTTF